MLLLFFFFLSCVEAAGAYSVRGFAWARTAERMDDVSYPVCARAPARQRQLVTVANGSQMSQNMSLLMFRAPVGICVSLLRVRVASIGILACV